MCVHGALIVSKYIEANCPIESYTIIILSSILILLALILLRKCILKLMVDWNTEVVVTVVSISSRKNRLLKILMNPQDKREILMQYVFGLCIRKIMHLLIGGSYILSILCQDDNFIYNLCRRIGIISQAVFGLLLSLQLSIRIYLYIRGIYNTINLRILDEAGGSRKLRFVRALLQFCVFVSFIALLLDVYAMILLPPEYNTDTILAASLNLNYSTITLMTIIQYYSLMKFKTLIESSQRSKDKFDLLTKKLSKLSKLVVVILICFIVLISLNYTFFSYCDYMLIVMYIIAYPSYFAALQL